MESRDCPIAHASKRVDQEELWRRIDALPTDLQKQIGKIFVGNRQWAQKVAAERHARLQAEHDHAQKTQRMMDDFWRERMCGMCG